MNELLRRSVLGMLAGAMASVSLVPALGHPRWTIVLGMVVGAAYAASLRPTLNLGLRYEVYTPLEEERNRIANFDPNTASIILAGANGVSRGGGVTTQYSNLAPRVGFAATVAPGTVVRGGYGISL